MGQIEKHGIKITYPDYGFVFNPYSIIMESEILTPQTVTLLIDPKDNTDNWINTTVVYNLAQYNSTTYRAVADISSIAQLKFSRDRFLGSIEKVDKTLHQTFTVIATVIRDNKPEKIGEFPCSVIWGGLQIGEQYKHRDTFIYWPGKPFTVPLLALGLENPLNWYERIDEETYSNKGPLPNGKYNLDIESPATRARRRIVYRFDKNPADKWPGIFDRTFDHTFRGYDENTFWINIDVAPCVRDGVYLRWIGPLGEWFYFNFDLVSRSRVVTNNPTVVENVYDFTEISPVHPGTGGSIGKEGQDNVVITATLINNEVFDYVWTLGTSPIVDMLVGDDLWVRVNIAPGTFNRTTAELQDITYTINLPKSHLQTL